VQLMLSQRHVFPFYLNVRIFWAAKVLKRNSVWGSLSEHTNDRYPVSKDCSTVLLNVG